MDLDKYFGNLTDELKTKAKQCKNPEELLKLAGAEGIDLTDEQMDAISGGWNKDEESIKYPTDGVEEDEIAQEAQL